MHYYRGRSRRVWEFGPFFGRLLRVTWKVIE